MSTSGWSGSGRTLEMVCGHFGSQLGLGSRRSGRSLAVAGEAHFGLHHGHQVGPAASARRKEIAWRRPRPRPTTSHASPGWRCIPGDPGSRCPPPGRPRRPLRQEQRRSLRTCCSSFTPSPLKPPNWASCPLPSTTVCSWYKPGLTRCDIVASAPARGVARPASRTRSPARRPSARRPDLRRRLRQPDPVCAQRSSAHVTILSYPGR